MGEVVDDALDDARGLIATGDAGEGVLLGREAGGLEVLNDRVDAKVEAVGLLGRAQLLVLAQE